MTELVVVGISWRTAPVAIREKLAFREDELTAALGAITQQLPVGAAVLISTGNRVEIYAVGRGTADAATAVRAFLVEQRGVGKAKDVLAAIYERRGAEAIRHVFRVASSLDSLVVGEAQILGQLKEAYALAGKLGTAGPLL